MRKSILRFMESKTTNKLLIDSTLTLKVAALPNSSGPNIEFPVFSSKLACGLFGISEDNIDKYQSLDTHLIKNKYCTFFFEAEGDSMEPTIYAKQIVIVDRSIKTFHRRVCVMSYEDKLICKRVSINGEYITLKSDNQKYKDIVVQNNENILLWGVVIAVAGFVT
jgi:DNA polymerase V